MPRQQALLAEALQLLDRGDTTSAQARLDESLALARQVGDVAVEAGATRTLGIVRSAAKDPVGARIMFDEALRLYESIHDQLGVARAYTSLGLLSWDLGRWADVRRYYGLAADAFDAGGNQVERAMALRSQTFDHQMSDADVVSVLQQALSIARAANAERAEGLILHQLGDTRSSQGDYAAALESLEVAAPLLERTGTPLEASFVATSLGRAYRLHGVPDRAVLYFEKAFAIQERLGDRRAMAQSLNSLAIAQKARGRTTEAMSLAARGLELARAVGNRGVELTLINTLGILQLEAGRPREALAVLESAFTDPDDPFLKGDEANLRTNLSRALTDVGRLDDALREAGRATMVAEGTGRPLDRTRALERRARVRFALGDAAGAFLDADLALDLFERMRKTLPPRDMLKQEYLDGDREVFALTIDLRARSGQAGAALAAAEKGRARAFQDLLAARALPLAKHGGVGGAQALGSQSTVEAPTLEDVTAVARRLDSPLITYWVAPHVTYIWRVSPQGDIALRTIEVDETTIEALAQAASAPPPNASRPRELQDLYDTLIAPIRDLLPSRRGARLTIIPHGPLFRVSFGALVNPQGLYLIEQYELHYAPAIGVLRFTGAIRRDAGIRHALFVADPNLPPSKGVPLTRLAGARQEVASAAQAVGSGTESLTGAQATEARVRALAPGRDVLHFATHSIVSDRDPLDSYLALGGSGTNAANDGRLTAAEIYGLNLDAGLVVLSACRSGDGRITGDGINGLSRAFFYAGTPSVIATLWDLADEPARLVMQKFYTYWRGGRTKAAALRAAQLDVLQALRAGTVRAPTPFGPVALTERPALWASYVLIGEP